MKYNCLQNTSLLAVIMVLMVMINVSYSHAIHANHYDDNDLVTDSLDDNEYEDENGAGDYDENEDTYENEGVLNDPQFYRRGHYNE
ncbi:hypothetical protein Smp_155080 [Schistosoma mansoni]|uniref:Secreted protein n=2 Tax=Schistosoma mansoni TaxID=6183 RepID=G4VT69_SCHMA|nr:hypothetical protein Smp_155080 [Schistosoma mansoni]|eukprot:XP_018655582.1 hypothetical protein Smp_155080 [Schistosoma mansoni]